ncbi:DUF2325 domain-containing protein [Desulfovibrio oxyclinae]|jgi:oligoribonuclease NrnB/cAMP/cGMP phosphodiesterase (DHH superfamily)|uniref:DUF2325 domain-containing protein n=1 Tax=Desulfovibrio oxyclinae TaxID=63560 RepID=UPI0003692D3C|nr:DUF2325 domain-containing protein [Desulfovibrio oxyclinae]
MCAALIGGMDRLKREYMNEAKKQGVKLKFFTGKERNISGSVGGVDLVVMFTNKISHKARNEVMGVVKSREIPMVMHHSCGVSSLRRCLHENKEI